MKKNRHLLFFRSLLVFVFLLVFNCISAQDSIYSSTKNSNFWKNVQFGGGIGLNFSTGYTDVFLAPSAIYNFNPIVAVGAGLNFNYVASSNFYSSVVYGISPTLLINPIPEIQLSLILNQNRVNYKDKSIANYSDDYWDTGLILGAGYRNGNVTVGVGYNVLKNSRYNTEPFVPFVRAYF